MCTCVACCSFIVFNTATVGNSHTHPASPPSIACQTSFTPSSTTPHLPPPLQLSSSK